MKRCPTCQKEFPDSMRFCQTDGTPLLDAVEPPPPVDPFKTMVAPPIVNTPSEPAEDLMKTMVVDHSKDDDLLQIPEVFDPMRTVVQFDDAKKSIPPKPSTSSEQVASAPPELPKFNEPSLSPPNFGDLSSSSTKEPSKPIEAPKFDSPFSAPVNEPPKFEAPSSPFNEPPKFEAPSSPFNEPPKVATPFSPFDEPPKVNPPVSSPFNDPPKFDPTPLPNQSSSNDSPFGQPMNQPISSPFDQPPSSTPFKEPSMGNPPPFENSPFNQPTPSFGQQNDQFNQPLQQNDWNPPPAPVANWQDQGLGSNTPFTPPPAGGGQNQILPIVSLVLGIISLCCYIGWITGPAALITGYLGMKNANTDPANYGGKGLAIAGMVCGGIFTLIWVIYWIFIILLYAGLIAGSALGGR